MKKFSSFLLESTIACGECFSWAFKNQKETDTLVHATVQPPMHDKRFPHAWIERGNKVLDWQTMVLGTSKFGKKGWPKKDFYDVFEPKNVKKFDRKKSRQNIFKYEHYGPWD